jgi:preprotein translocase subunit SecG
MGFIIGLLTLVMVLDCVLLILLVLIQLPKKEAGMGLAFGGAATDALFGAGSGNVLTKITKYSAGTFFVMAIVLSALQSNYYKHSNAFLQKLSTPLSAPPGMVPPSAPPASAPSPAQAAPPASSSTAPQPSLFSGTNALKSAPVAEDNKLPTPPPAAVPSSNGPAPK